MTPIDDRNLQPGTTLRGNYKKVEYKAEVVAGDDGKVQYRFADGHTFKSPSAAAKEVMGGKAVNGWAFWSVQGAEAPATAQPATAPATLTKPQKGAKAPAPINPAYAEHVAEPAATPTAANDAGEETQMPTEATAASEAAPAAKKARPVRSLPKPVKRAKGKGKRK